MRGSLGGAAVWRLPLAQGAILETRDRIPHRAPGAWSLLLPLPVSLRLSLSLCDYHKKKLKKNLRAGLGDLKKGWSNSSSSVYILIWGLQGH